MPRVLIPLGIIALGVIIYSLVECLMTPKHQVRALPKAVWVLVVLLVPVVGALLWLFLGRRRGSGRTTGGPRPAPRPPASPDDDEAFLRQLDVQRRQKARQDELDRWETELKARERQSTGDAESAPSGSGSSGPDDGDAARQDGGGSGADQSGDETSAPPTPGAATDDAAPADPAAEPSSEDFPEHGRDTGAGR